MVDKKQNEKRKKIALVGGSFKPPTAGHWSMVEKYANLADEVKVIISNPKSPKSIRKTKTGIIITPEMSKNIWDIFINRYGLKNKVSVEISEKPSPITAVYEYIDNEVKDAIVFLGASKKDDDYKRFSNAKEYFKDREDIEIIDPEKAAVIPHEGKDGIPFSATKVRDNIDNPKLIAKMMPSKLTKEDIEKIVAILSKVDESKQMDTKDEMLFLHNLNEDEIIDFIVANCKDKCEPKSITSIAVHPGMKGMDNKNIYYIRFVDNITKRAKYFRFIIKDGKLKPFKDPKVYNGTDAANDFYQYLLRSNGKLKKDAIKMFICWGGGRYYDN